MSRRISIFGASFASVSYLLDDATIASGIAAPFALFRLKTGYTGPVVDVRRTVGATTTIVSVGLGIGAQFTLDAPVTGVVTGSSSAANLGEFVNASGYANPDSLPAAQDWFYSKGYNQNNGAQVWVQATATQQPRGGTAGVMRTRNGRAEMGFDGSNDWCDFGLIGGATKPPSHSIIAACGWDSPTSQSTAMFGSADFGTAGALTWGSATNFAVFAGQLFTTYGAGSPIIDANRRSVYTSSAVITAGQQMLIELYKQNGVIDTNVYTNGVSRPTTLFTGTAVDAGGENFKFALGTLGESSAYNINGGCQFIAVWTATKESDRLAIKTKINEMLGTTW